MSTQTIEEKKKVIPSKLDELRNLKPAEVEKKTIAQNVIEKFKPELPKTPEERILSAKQFEALSARYGALKEKDQELKTFHAGNDKTNAKIVFQNSQGYSFEVRNSSIISRLTSSAQDELEILLNEAKNEIMTFQM
jgi:hypothetical protein